MNEPRLGVTIEDLSAAVRRRIWRGYLREFFGDLISTFLIVAFLVLGSAWVMMGLLVDGHLSKIIAVGCGVGAGTLACGYLLIKETELFVELRRDLSCGKYERLSVVSIKAVQVDLPDDREAIVLDCGERTLIIARGWWKRSRTVGIHWDGKREVFPSTEFTMDRLPRSGVVMAVVVGSKSLRLNKECLIDPQLDLVVPRYMSSYWVERQLRAIPILRCSAR